ncbi:hypothetical protein EJ06DRAFT_123778 [Trichodelitschia bisporula]|uniref:Rhodopsin domain-containing protein n=1 Tax=Trichodelitschia bisporula TaxID=703511 RepID=A0A6G1HQU5_9PEZI|nr:hypothetical protein EJ06DRAFT_123778 [Trichodelitschia bisporula]
MAIESPTPKQLLVESIIWFSIGLVLFIGRLCSRRLLKGSWKNLGLDDGLMVLTFVFYTVLLILLQLAIRHGTNQMQPHEIPAVLADPAKIRDRIYGSKVIVGSNQAYLLTLWGTKSCMLALYYRMTANTSAQTVVKFVMGYTILWFLIIEITYLTICRPFSQYWAIIPSNPQCYNYNIGCILVTVGNVSSDLLMLGIPIPFVLHSQLPPMKQAALVGTFSLGLFVIVAAVLGKAYNFALPKVTIFLLWDVRETSTAVFVANLICLWPLARKLFGWRSFLRGTSGRQTGLSGGKADDGHIQMNHRDGYGDLASVEDGRV